MTGVDLFIALLGEGFRAALDPTTRWVLVVGLAIALMAREFAGRAMIAYGLGVLIMAWARFSGRLGPVNSLVVAAVLLTVAAALYWPPIRRIDWISIAAGAVAGAAAASSWQPFVDEALGSLIMGLPARGPSAMVPLAVFVSTALSPLLAFGAIHHLLPDPLLEAIEPPLSIVGGVLTVTLAFAVVAGVHGNLLGG